MEGIVYKVTCMTNLHVGNGEMNFDIIDNTVEKDPVTGLPTINSSGVKGALRQYFKENGADEKEIELIFGSAKSNPDETKTNPGQVKFYQADMLARPARATMGDRSYYMVTSYEAMRLYDRKVEIFGGEPVSFTGNGKNCSTEEGIAVEEIKDITKIPESESTKKIKGLIASEFVILKDVLLKNMVLPVLARNQLTDGISNNLWYEEVVPHESIFTFAVSSDNEKALNTFDEKIGSAAYVQFGGNATIGYGLCKVERIGGKANGV